MFNTEIMSELPVGITEQLTKLIFECLQECLLVVEKVTTVHQEFPHKLAVSIEWVRYSSRKSNPSLPGSCAVRVDSVIHYNIRDEKKSVQGYCESFQFDLSNIPEEDIESVLWDGIVTILMQVHTRSLLQINKKITN